MTEPELDAGSMVAETARVPSDMFHGVPATQSHPSVPNNIFHGVPPEDTHEHIPSDMFAGVEPTESHPHIPSDVFHGLPVAPEASHPSVSSAEALMRTSRIGRASRKRAREGRRPGKAAQGQRHGHAPHIFPHPVARQDQAGLLQHWRNV